MMRRRIALALALVVAQGASAQAEPIVRVEVTPERVAVGEPVQLRVTVLVPTWFARPPVYPSFELSNAITRLPPDSAYPTSERVGRDTWSGIIRNYRVYPLLGANYVLSGQTINISYANPGSDPVTVDVEIPEVVFRGAVPEGAQALDPYIAGTRLDLALDIEGDVADLAAGDAVVLSYRAELEGLPAIFLPPLAPALDFEGVSVYADQPDVEEGATAVRSERVTLVFESGGEFRIPPVELAFWNTGAGAVETVVAEGLALSVTGPPASQSEGETKPTAGKLRRNLLLIAVAVLVLVVAWRSTPVLIRRRRQAVARRRATEQYAFDQLRSALRAGQPGAAYDKMLAWLDRLQPGLDARRFAAESGDAELASIVDGLSGSLYGAAQPSPELRRAVPAFAAARKAFLRQARDAVGRGLPGLNP